MRMRPAVTLSFLRASVLIEFKHVAVFEHNGMFHGAGFHGELGVASKVAIVAVNGNEELGTDEIDEEAQSLPGSRGR